MNSAVIGSMTADVAPAAPATGSGSSACDELGQVYDRYGALAFSLAYRILRDRGLAEDVVQESFVALWRNADRYDPTRASMRSWLCRIVRNRAIDRLRGTAGRQRHDYSLDDITAMSSAADVVSDVLRREETRLVLVALAALPPAQRQAIELAYYGGYTQTEIAALTAAPLGTVKGRTRLAMRALAVALAPMRA